MTDLERTELSNILRTLEEAFEESNTMADGQSRPSSDMWLGKSSGLNIAIRQLKRFMERHP